MELRTGHGDRDDRWEPELAASLRSSSSSSKSLGMHRESLTSLPAIASPGVVPTPPPPSMTSKSKLKPPSQRVTLVGSLSGAKPPNGGSSPLKLPSLVKPSAVGTLEPVEPKLGNQEAEEDVSGSSRSLLSNGPRGSVVDKHRDYIKDLEEQKRKEKEAQVKREERRRKMQKKLTEKILQEAALARIKPQQDEPEDSATPEEPEPAEEQQDDEEKRQREKEAKRQRKKLLKKQQALLETLQAKKREKQEEEEQEKERERRRQHKLKKAVLDAIHASKAEEVEEDDVVQGDENEDNTKQPMSPVKSVPEEDEENGIESDNQLKIKKHRKHKTKRHRRCEPEDVHTTQESHDKSPPAEIATEMDIESTNQSRKTKRGDTDCNMEREVTEDKAKAKSSEAVNKKQQEYLQKLAEQRRLKQQEDEEAKLAQEKRRKRVQLEAQQKLQEAAFKAQQQRLKEEQEAAEQEQEEEKKVVVDVNAMVARLSKLKEKDAQVIPEARDFVSWKKRHGVRSDQKVFCMTGWYPVIRECLEARGWYFNEERGSPFFDLKWSLKSDDLKGIKLKEDQYVNHFFSNTAITTKVGLLHTLRGLAWHQSVDVDTVFPRAYDLNEPRDMDAFVMDFRYTFAEGVLKEVARTITHADKQGVRLNEAFVSVLLAVGRKKLKAKQSDDMSGESLEDSVDNLLSVGVDDLVTDLEWEVLTKHQLDAPGKFRASLMYRKKIYADERDSNILPGDVQPSAAGGPIVDTVMTALEKKQQRQLDKLKAEAFQREKALLGDKLSRVSVLDSSQCDELLQLTRALEAACPQFHLNGGGDVSSRDPQHKSRNVWIVKPAGLSRGRGIRVFNELDALLAYADVETHKECQWVAQKYIENPLLLCRRKFDIRQWVLVTSWDPLTVWIYEDFYLRFSSEQYSTEDLSDQFVHLTNNSIQKYSDKFHAVYASDDGALQVEGNMLHSDAFREYLATRLGVDEAAYEQTLRAAMKRMVVQSLQCAQDQIQHRKHACELYGYDFMLDETLRPWLIEVNSSPACDYSTPTAQRYVETGLAGIVQVIVDHREYEARKKSGVSGGDHEPPTGRWRRLHRGECVGKPLASLGAELEVRGAKVRRRKAPRPAVAEEEDATL